MRLSERKPLAFNAWHEQARHFYIALLADTETQNQLARFRLTGDTLQATQAQVEQTFALNSAQEQEKGEAQNATQQRDAAIEALAEWLSDFKVVARIALADSPQLLESLRNRNLITCAVWHVISRPEAGKSTRMMVSDGRPGGFLPAVGMTLPKLINSHS
jgi:hypothetical protein